MICRLIRVEGNSLTEVCKGTTADCRTTQMGISRNFSGGLGSKVKSISMNSESTLSVLLVNDCVVEYKILESLK